MENINKIQKMSKIVYIICNVLRIFTLIGIFATLATSLFLIALPKDTVILSTSGSELIKVSNKYIDNEVIELIVGQEDKENNDNYTTTKTEDGIEFSTTLKDTTIDNRHIGVLLLPFTISLVFIYFILMISKKIFKILRDTTNPFTSEISSSIKDIAYILVGYCFVPSIISSILLVIFSISSGTTFESCSLVVSLNLSYLVFAFIVFLLSHIFDYGCELYNDKR